MERCIRRQIIFNEELDYQVFLEIMRTAQKKYNCRIHAYCLMTNHFHILLETEDIEVYKYVQYLASCYASFYNHKYGFTGHLFEGRYKRYLVKDYAYFLQTSRYIHLNPVKAKIVNHAEEYPWSSYKTIIGIKDDRITEVNQTWKYFRKNPTIQYRNFVEDIGHKY